MKEVNVVQLGTMVTIPVHHSCWMDSSCPIPTISHLHHVMLRKQKEMNKKKEEDGYLWEDVLTMMTDRLAL